MTERDVLDQLDVPLRAQPGRVCVVKEIPACSFCRQAGIFDFTTVHGGWAHGCLWHYIANRSSDKLGVGSAQLWITESQVGMTQLPRG